MMIFPAIDGQQGILPNHESMVTAVKAGELRFKVNGKFYYLYVFFLIVSAYIIYFPFATLAQNQIDGFAMVFYI